MECWCGLYCCECMAGEKAEVAGAVEKALCVLGMPTYGEATASRDARGVAAIGMGRCTRDEEAVATVDVRGRAEG